MIYLCCDEHRRNAVRTQCSLQGIDFNGIDFLEVCDAHTLKVHFVHPLITQRLRLLKKAALNEDNVRITGGVRIRDIAVESVAIDTKQPTVLTVRVNKPGDYATYTLSIAPDPRLLRLDVPLSKIDFTFKPPAADVDCRTSEICVSEVMAAPEIDYLAKDFNSFRRLMLDRLSVLIPDWKERSIADMGVMLVEILAYVGDHLSYQQDVIATESYLSTARRRISVRRHARLLDYFVSEGCNARVWVQVQVRRDMVKQSDDDPSPLPKGTVLLTKVAAQDNVLLPINSFAYTQALIALPEVYETMYDVDGLYREHNEMYFYTWGARDCCLPKGATSATLYGNYSHLQPGDVLIFKEICDPRTGSLDDANPAHRHVVRLTKVKTNVDPLGKYALGTQDGAPGNIYIEEIRIKEKERREEDVTIIEEGRDVQEEEVERETYKLTERRIIQDGQVIEDLRHVDERATEKTHEDEEDEKTLVNEDTTLINKGVAGIEVILEDQTIADVVLEDEEQKQIASQEEDDEWYQGNTQPLRFSHTSEQQDSSIDEDEHAHKESTAGARDKRTKELTQDEQDEGEVVEEETDVLTERKDSVEETAVAVDGELVEAERHGEDETEVETEKRELIAEPDYSVAITEIEWHYEDALPFPLCISATTDYEYDHEYLEHVSVVLGNIVLADHGQTLASEAIGSVPPSVLQWAVAGNGNRCGKRQSEIPVSIPPRYYPSLKQTPLTFAVPLSYTTPYDKDNPPPSAYDSLQLQSRDAVPAITLASKTAANDAGSGTPTTATWLPKRDLLNSNATDPHFVVEIESDGSTYLRFGDGQLGLVPAACTSFTATYRVGNGTKGNVGADALYHIVSRDDRIEAINNPVPAAGGVDAETIEDIRQKASGSFTMQERGVTPEDYKDIAKRYHEVRQANAVIRWTGSWYTVFLVVERAGGMAIDDAFKQELHQYMEHFCMAGGDLVIVEPIYVPLEIAMTVCIQSNYLPGDVKEALLKVFSNRLWPDGVKGMFYTDNYTFGQTIYLNDFLLAASTVPGVASVKEITKFQRQGVPGSGLKDGEITLDWREIARLDNDPHYPEHGLLYINVEYCS